VAQALIDSRLAVIHSNDVLSVELVPANQVGTIIDNSFKGAVYLRMSLQEALSGVVVRIDSFELEKYRDYLHKSQLQIENINYEQYQTLKEWFLALRTKHPFLIERKIRLLAFDEFGRHRYAVLIALKCFKDLY
jgi:hypothetical protein